MRRPRKTCARPARPSTERAAAALDAETMGRARRAAPGGPSAARSETYEVDVDRERARFGAWYELFPRSSGGFAGVPRRSRASPTWASTSLYLPPIHPIGTTHRKGRNNSPGRRARRARQPLGDRRAPRAATPPCTRSSGRSPTSRRWSPRRADTAWRSRSTSRSSARPTTPGCAEHPEWFHRRPDGTLKYAENPPKRYQDIYNVNFDSDDWRGAVGGAARRRRRSGWSAGVRIFRVDNPHTKPIGFWEWLIRDGPRGAPRRDLPGRGVHQPGADVRAGQGRLQPVVHLLHLEELGARSCASTSSELAGPVSEFFRPNFFVNTPDILHEYLQNGGRPAFEARLVLAATLSPSYGDLLAASRTSRRPPVEPGSEEYLDSEKYEVKERRLDGPLLPLISRLNEIRRALAARSGASTCASSRPPTRPSSPTPRDRGRRHHRLRQRRPPLRPGGASRWCPTTSACRRLTASAT